MVKYTVGAGCCFCQECQYACPVHAITMDKNGAHIDKEKCIGCGKCDRVCPLGNIRMENGQPRWGENCTHCMACICGCPTEAIEYGKKSVGKPRYRCPEWEETK